MADADDPDLRDRVAELEATVEAQQQTIQQLLPSRRRVLQAGGLLAGGGVLGALSADRASADVTGQVGTQQDRVDVFAGDVDANSVKTNEANITGESAATLTRSNNSPSTNAGIFINAVDTTDTDNKSEVTASQEFVPAETGIYIMYITARIGGNTTSGDTIAVRVRNVGTSSTLGQKQKNATGSVAFIASTFIQNLTAGESYEIQVRNSDSSFIIDGVFGQTNATILRSVVNV